MDKTQELANQLNNMLRTSKADLDALFWNTDHYKNTLKLVQSINSNEGFVRYETWSDIATADQNFKIKDLGFGCYILNVFCSPDRFLERPADLLELWYNSLTTRFDDLPKPTLN